MSIVNDMNWWNIDTTTLFHQKIHRNHTNHSSDQNARARKLQALSNDKKSFRIIFKYFRIKSYRLVLAVSEF